MVTVLYTIIRLNVSERSDPTSRSIFQEVPPLLTPRSAGHLRTVARLGAYR
jgi:hypothetical protein